MCAVPDIVHFFPFFTFNRYWGAHFSASTLHPWPTVTSTSSHSLTQQSHFSTSSTHTCNVEAKGKVELEPAVKFSFGRLFKRLHAGINLIATPVMGGINVKARQPVDKDSEPKNKKCVTCADKAVTDGKRDSGDLSIVAWASASSKVTGEVEMTKDHAFSKSLEKEWGTTDTKEWCIPTSKHYGCQCSHWTCAADFTCQKDSNGHYRTKVRDRELLASGLSPHVS